MALYRGASHYASVLALAGVCLCLYLLYTSYGDNSTGSAAGRYDRRGGGLSPALRDDDGGSGDVRRPLRPAEWRPEGAEGKDELARLSLFDMAGGGGAPPPFRPSAMPIIWIGGMPRSGTTLMRALLDAHPTVRCGEETRVIPRILGMRAQWMKNAKESKRLEEAGVAGDVLNAAVASFILNVIVRHGEPAGRYCNKDPFTLKSVQYLSTLFPKSKFILMVRDGRAVVHSIISRKVTITGFNLSDPKQCLEKWSAAMTTMYDQCERSGPSVCMPVYYEQLVLQPKKWLAEILDFLGLPWDEAVLHHEDKIGSEISLSLVERSTDQIAKPVNTDALSKWVGFYSDEVLARMDDIAPMLHVLGYDPRANPPNYGKADELVRKKTDELHNEEQRWNAKIKEIYAKKNMTNPIPQN